MTNKVYGLIGIAAKAGKVTSGGNTCEIPIIKGKAKLVIIAGDSADNTKKRFHKIAVDNGVPVRVFGSCENLGKFCGKDRRSVLTVNDNGFALKLMALIDDSSRINGGGIIGENQSI